MISGASKWTQTSSRWGNQSFSSKIPPRWVKDPASVSQRFRLGEILCSIWNLKQRSFWANWCCFSNYESECVKSLRNWKFPASSKKTLPRLARSSKLDQHPCPLAFHISPDQKLNKSNLRQNPGSRFSVLSCSCWRRCGRGSSTTMPG